MPAPRTMCARCHTRDIWSRAPRRRLHRRQSLAARSMAAHTSTAGEDGASTHSADLMRWCGCVRCAGAVGAHAGAGQALWRVAAAEGAGAALLVLLTCAAGCAPAALDFQLQRATASGLVVALLVQCFDHVSGAQMNPTVTLAALVWGRVSRRRALCEVAAQLAGAVLGAGLLRVLRPGAAALCVTSPAPALSPALAACVEALLGGCLALANCGSWDARNAGVRDSWPLRVGLAVAGLSLVGGELTGASMNPVRSFGPALWSGRWTSHWVYWVGPLGGSVLFTSAYVCVWRPYVPRGDVTPRCDVTPRGDVTPLPGKASAEA